jgi:pyruvate formate lyase activating enzyme
VSNNSTSLVERFTVRLEGERPVPSQVSNNPDWLKLEELPLGTVHSYEPSAMVDGPGVRFNVFLAGCPLRCRYCHNPDTWLAQGHARKTVNEVVAEIAKYASFLKFAGGVTISGGEPLAQPRFVHALLSTLKERWQLHTALDTTGHGAALLPDEWFDVVDMALLDIKHSDAAQHRFLTGAALRPTLEFAERMGGLNIPLWIRHVLVPGLTDKRADVQRLADIVSKLHRVERVEILGYHTMGRAKWDALGLKYTLDDVRTPTEEELEAVREVFRQRGLFVC